MTPATIIERAAADGVRLTLTAPGKLKAIGDKQAVIRWLPILTEHKPELMAALSAPITAKEIEESVAEFFEERAAITEYDGGLTREEAEKEAREATERYRRECWERHQRNAERILSLPTREAREQALERYGREAVAQYGEATGVIMVREMTAWIRFRRGLTP